MNSIGAFLSSAVLLLVLATPATAQDDDHQAIIETLTSFFEGFAEADSVKMMSHLEGGGRVVVTYTDGEGNPGMRPIEMGDFISIITSPREQPIKETFWNPEIRVEDNLASVWVEYNLWVGDEISHCGTDNFQLVRRTDGWKIISIADTQVRTGCEPHYE